MAFPQSPSEPVFEPRLAEPALPENPDAWDTKIDVSYGAPLALKKETPAVMLARKKAQALATAQAEQRRKDSVAVPAIQIDMEASAKHQRELQEELRRTREALTGIQQPTYQPAELSTGDSASAILSGLFGGAQGFNQSIAGGYQRADQLAGQRFNEAQQKFQLDRANAEFAFEEAQGNLQQEQQVMRALRAQLIESLQAEDAETRQWALENLNHIQALERQREAGQQAQELEGLRQEGRLNVEGLKGDNALRKLQLDTVKSLLKSAGDLSDDNNRAVAFASLLSMVRDGRIDAELLSDPEVVLALSGDTNSGLAKQASTNLSNVRAEDIEATRSARIADLQARTGVSKQRAQYIAKQVSWFDREAQADVAKAYAVIDNYKDQIRHRGVAEAQADARIDVAKLQAVQKGINGMVGEIIGLEKRNVALSGALTTRIDPDSGAPIPKDSPREKQIKAEITANQQKVTNLREGARQLREEAKPMLDSVMQPASTARGANSPDPIVREMTRLKGVYEKAGYKVEQFGPGSIPGSLHNDGRALDIYPKSGQTIDQISWRLKRSFELHLHHR